MPIIEELKPKARAAGLWNLFLPKRPGDGLTNLEYAPLAEIMGRVPGRPRCSTAPRPIPGTWRPSTRYGTEEHKQHWLAPLLGRDPLLLRMTEPDVASSDATNIQTRITREGDRLRDQRAKWWSSGAGDPRCEHLHRHGQDRPDSPDKYRSSR